MSAANSAAPVISIIRRCQRKEEVRRVKEEVVLKAEWSDWGERHTQPKAETLKAEKLK